MNVMKDTDRLINQLDDIQIYIESDKLFACEVKIS